MGMDMDMTDETVVSGDSELPKSRWGAAKQTPDDRRSQARCLGCLLASRCAVSGCVEEEQSSDGVRAQSELRSGQK